MSRNTEYQFVSLDTTELENLMIASYERITGSSVSPASPERLFIKWVTSIILQERMLQNWTGNQNIPSRADGENLDALGELFWQTSRPQAQAATCTVRFTISAAQRSSILIAKGTRVTDMSRTLYWETTQDTYVPIGQTYVDIPVRCMTEGEDGNGYQLGQLNTIVDVYDYYDECSNITTSEGGADAASDDEYYELMRSSMDAYSTAGARGSYIYYAKQVSTEIADVVANSPSAGAVCLYVLMEDGSKAGTEIKNAVLKACNADDVRPLTDSVSVADPNLVTYNIDLTYYIQNDTAMSAAEIAKQVDAAVEDYKAWQSGKLGRDINPSQLIALLMDAGIKRVDVRSPAFKSMRDGSDNTVPQLAKVGTVTVTNGGYEDE